MRLSAKRQRQKAKRRAVRWATVTYPELERKLLAILREAAGQHSKRVVAMYPSRPSVIQLVNGSTMVVANPPERERFRGAWLDEIAPYPLL